MAKGHPVPEFENSFNDYEHALVSEYGVEAALSHLSQRKLYHHFQYDISPKSRGWSGGQSKHGPGESYRGNQDRIRLMWDGRDAYRNNPIVAGIIEKIIQYAVPSLTYMPNTGDVKQNQRLSKYVNEYWGNHCDITGRFQLVDLVRHWLAARWIDGDHGVILVVKGGELKLQSVEADRIGPVTATNHNENIIGGIHVKKDGSIKGVDIYQRNRFGTYQFEKFIPAASFIHISTPAPGRPSEYRSRSRLAIIHKIARDFNESLQYEYNAGKMASQVAGIYRSPEVGYGDPDFLKKGGPLDEDKDSVHKNKDGSYKIPEAKLIGLNYDEELQFLPSVNRPSGAFKDYMAITMQSIAHALNVPYGFIWDMENFGGVSSRFQVEFAHRTMKELQDLMVPNLNRIVEKAILLGAASGKIPPHVNNLEGSWHWGRWLTADIGHEAQADIAKIQAGVMSVAQYAQKHDTDEDTLIDDQIAYTKKLIDKCAAAGVPVEAVIQTKPGLTEMMAAYEQGQAPPTPEPTPSPMEDPATAKIILELITKVAEGSMPRDSALATLIYQYQIPPDQAEVIVPQEPAPAPPPAPPAPIVMGHKPTDLGSGGQGPKKSFGKFGMRKMG